MLDPERSSRRQATKSLRNMIGETHAAAQAEGSGELDTAATITAGETLEPWQEAVTANGRYARQKVARSSSRALSQFPPPEITT